MSEKKILSENDINRLDSIKNALKDNNFVEFLIKLETAEDVQAAFKEKDVELSLDEINKIKTLMRKISEDSNELSDNELDDVVGGFIIGPFIPNVIDALDEVLKKPDVNIKW